MKGGWEIMGLLLTKVFLSSRCVVVPSAGLLGEHVLSHHGCGIDTMGGLGHYLDTIHCFAE